MSDHPKVIFIDWYKTLSTSLFWVAHPEAQLNPTQLASISQYVFSQPNLIVDWMRGFIVSEHVVSKAAKSLQLDADKIQNELQYSCEAMELYDAKVVDQVCQLRGRAIKVILATDNMDTFDRWTVPALKLDTMFDGVITSVRRGALKADMQEDYSPFFSHYLGQNGIAAEGTVLIDDIPIEATAKLGMGFRRVKDPAQLTTILSEFL